MLTRARDCGTIRAVSTFVERVVGMLGELALDQVEVTDESVRVSVPLEGGTAVAVSIRVCGEMHGKEVLEFATDGLRLPTDDAAKMPLLILALQRNADVMLGHWGLDEAPEGSTLRVFHQQITETMDPPELRGALLGVADEHHTLSDAFADILAPRPG
jgi:hypothetical protein